MKAKNVGGREPFLDNPRTTCIVLSEDERDVIEGRKENQSVSEFVRDSIRIRGDSSDNLLIREIQELKEENLQIRHELDLYRQKETVTTKIKADAIADMGVAYAAYMKQTHPTEHYRNNWIDGRCKSAGVSPIEFLAYVEDKVI